MKLTVALIREVFPEAQDISRLRESLQRARGMGAELAVLPELPLNRWAPATKKATDDDAEEPGGRRSQALADAARAAGIGLIGGAIVRDSATGKRHNTALVFDAAGTQVASYRKLYLPEEDGFWETSHYEPGDALSSVIEAFPLRLGLQICSDVNRPESSRLLAALGAEIIVAPRATEAATFSRWKTVFLAIAMTSCAYIVSVPRPRPELGVPLGGPAFVAAPNGDVLAETTDPLTVVTLDRARLDEARRQYPGYLATRADLLGRGWTAAKSSKLPHRSD